MSLATEICSIRYSGNDSTTVFPIMFPIAEEEHLTVTLADEDDVQTILVLDTDFAITGDYEAGEGSITYPISGDPLPAGHTITLKRVVPLKQLTDFNNQGGFFAETHEDAFDKLTMIVQQQQEEIDRCVKVSLTSGETGEDIYDQIEEAVANAVQAQASATAAQAAAASAAQSAEDAAGAEAAKTAAQAAQVAAETAKTDAETAETHAETAQTAAESAQSAAEAAAAGVNLPSIVSGDAGKVLKVKSDESGYENKEWGDVVDINALTEKTTLVDDDLFVIEDSAASNAKKKVKKVNISPASGSQEYTTGSGNWTCPSGVTKIFVTLVGGGGTGGNGTHAAYNAVGPSGGGGGSGGHLINVPYTVTPGNTYAYSVGAAGANTTFGTGTVLTGAAGGEGSTYSSETANGHGIPGSPGLGTYGSPGGGNGSAGGAGAGSMYGAGGAGGGSSSNGSSPSAGCYGAGGGGGGSIGGTGTTSGGAGAGGYILIKW